MFISAVLKTHVTDRYMVFIEYSSYDDFCEIKNAESTIWQQYIDHKKLNALLEVGGKELLGSRTGLWKFVNNKQKHEITKMKNDENIIVKDKKHIADELNNYFVDLGKKLADKIPCKDARGVNSRRNPYLIIFLETDEDEVKKDFHELKAPGPDGLRSKAIKNISTHIMAPLTYLIYKIISAYFRKFSRWQWLYRLTNHQTEH
ncbi:hypothetical protein HHI36_011359 [Cryptolaemus montrouzieri]|uniref:Uncharacterized protein n=1 Tax=Cryptolaemus montrouzieri TaxID=559131 RepID=A0ABD2MLM8_9CUCU